MFSSVLLPEPDGPDRDEVARLDVQTDPVEGGHEPAHLDSAVRRHGGE